jgi:hypothetical protein
MSRLRRPPVLLLPVALLALVAPVGAQQAAPAVDASSAPDVPAAEPTAAVAPLADAAAAPDAPAPAEPAIAAGVPSPLGQPGVPPVASAGPSPAAPAPSSVDRAVLRSVAVGIRSFHPGETMDAAVAALEALGAYVQQSRTGHAELRVPADRLDQALERLRGVGEVVREDVASEDVTLELATLQARAEELESSRRRVQSMLVTALDVSDSLAVEQMLREVTGELEAQLGRLRFLRQRVELSPLSLDVSARERPAAPLRPERQPFRWVQQYGLEGVLR